MKCPNCGHLNSDLSTYCSACASPLAAETKLKPVEVGRSLLGWFLGIAASVSIVFLLLSLLSILIVALHDAITGHRFLIGLGYVMAVEGGIIGLVSAFGLFQIPEKTVMTRKVNLSPLIFFNTIFTPLRSASLSTPKTYYDRSIVLIAASFLVFLTGLLLAG